METLTISERTSLSPDEMAEALALKALCDAHEGLDIKLGFGRARDHANADAPAYPAALLARVDGALIGYCSLEGDAEEAEISGMTHPEWRRQDVAARLYTLARAGFARAGGSRLIAVCEDASVGGRGFLAAQGARREFAEHHMQFHGERAAPPADSALSVTRAQAEDIPALAAALAHAFGQDATRTQRDLTQMLDEPTEQLYVARLDGATIGGFRLSVMPDAVGIYGFAVDPAYQRRGLGRRMLAEACALAPAGRRVTLEVDTDNAPAIALYRSSGFTTTTTYGYYPCPLASEADDASR